MRIKKIIDISLPIDTKTATFPGDTPFSFAMIEGDLCNVSSFSMSPHVGTHTDSYGHVEPLTQNNRSGTFSLEPFIGPCQVIELPPETCAITAKLLKDKKVVLPRILFKTKKELEYSTFEYHGAYLTLDAVDFLAKRKVKLVGVDSPSVDPVDSKTLDAHHALIRNRLVWLENLDLTQVKQGEYFLSALPIKFIPLEAAPVRAVLLELDK